MKNLKNRLRAAWAAFKNPLVADLGKCDMNMAWEMKVHGFRAIAEPFIRDDGQAILTFKILTHDDDDAIKWGLDI